MKYAVYLEKDPDSDFGVTVPDLPGCFSAGTTVEEALENAAEAILTHLEGLLLDGETVPAPTSVNTLRTRSRARDLTWALVDVDPALLSTDVRRINVSIPAHLLSKVDAFARREGETRSGLLSSAVIEYISARNR